MSAKLLPTAAAASASSSASAFPPAAQMVYDVLRALPEGSQPSTTDLWHAVHARFPSDPDAPPLQAMPPRFTLKPVEPRFARPYPNHPFGSKSHFKDGFLSQLKDKRLLQLAHVRPQAADGTPAKSQRGVRDANVFYWRFHPTTGRPTDRETGAISPEWKDAFANLTPVAPGPLRVAETILRWSSKPLPQSKDNNTQRLLVPGKFGLPSPTLRKGKPALTEREVVVKELKKYHVLNRQKRRLLPDRIIAFRRWEDEVAAVWATDGADGVKQLFARAAERRAERAKRARARLGLTEEPAAVDLTVRTTAVGQLAKSGPVARENVRLAFARLHATRAAVRSLSAELARAPAAAGPEHEAAAAAVAAAEAELEDVRADVDALLVDLPAAEADEARQRVLDAEREFRTARALEKERRELVGRRERLAEERKA